MTKHKEINYTKTHQFWNSQVQEVKKQPLRVGFLKKYPEINDYLDKIEKKQFLKLMMLNSNMNVLDLGCGTGRWTLEFAKRCKKVVSVDFLSNLLEIAKENAKKSKFTNIEFIECSVIDFDYPTSFDIILVSEVLMYLNDDDLVKVPITINKLLSKRGKLILKEHVERERSRVTGSYNAIYREQDDYIKLFKCREFECSQAVPQLPNNQ